MVNLQDGAPKFYVCWFLTPNFTVVISAMNHGYGSHFTDLTIKKQIQPAEGLNQLGLYSVENRMGQSLDDMLSPSSMGTGQNG